MIQEKVFILNKKTHFESKNLFIQEDNYKKTISNYGEKLIKVIKIKKT